MSPSLRPPRLPRILSKTSPYPHHLLRNVVPDTMAVCQNMVRKAAFLPDVRHLAAPLLGLIVASASGSVGVREGGRF